MIFFTSDTHFGHTNILKYCPRPFKTIGEMNEGLIKNWNAVISKGDLVYHVGDFSMGTPDDTIDILRRLNGTKFLIRGNHDKVIDKNSITYKTEPNSEFEWVKDYHEMKVWDEEMDLRQRIVLCHYPLQVWKNNHHGSWHLHGHCHGTLPSSDSMSRLDVGVDPNLMKPVSYERVKEIMTLKVFKPVDHHGTKQS